MYKSSLKNLLYAVAGSVVVVILVAVFKTAMAEEVRPERVSSDYNTALNWLAKNHQWYKINIASTQLDVECNPNHTCKIIDSSNPVSLPVGIQIVPTTKGHSWVKYLGVID